MLDRIIREDRLELESFGTNLMIRFRNYIPNKYKSDYNPNIAYKVSMDVYRKKDERYGPYGDDDNLGYYVAEIDRDNNIHGDIAQVGSFTSDNEEEKQMMKGLGKFVLCTLTRYIVDTYGVELDKMFYGSASGGTPYFNEPFDEPIYQIYHPKMCKLSNSNFINIVRPHTTKSGRIIPPLLTDSQLLDVVTQIVPDINLEEGIELLRKNIEILLKEGDMLDFIKKCIEVVFPLTWNDIQSKLRDDRNRMNIISMMRHEGIPEEKYESSYYENIMCEIISTHGLMNYYETQIGFKAIDRREGRFIKMAVKVGERLEKCGKTEEMFKSRISKEDVQEILDSQESEYYDGY